MFRRCRKHQRHILKLLDRKLAQASNNLRFFADAEPVVKVERSQGECERNVVATASTATTTHPEINRRFMETPVWLEMQFVACTTGLRPTAAGGCDLLHLSRTCF